MVAIESIETIDNQWLTDPKTTEKRSFSMAAIPFDGDGAFETIKKFQL